MQFDLQDDMRDIGAVSLLLGVRDNDLKGLSVDDLSAMAEAIMLPEPASRYPRTRNVSPFPSVSIESPGT